MDQKTYEIAEKLVIASKRAYNRGIQTGSGGNVSACLLYTSISDFITQMCGNRFPWNG